MSNRHGVTVSYIVFNRTSSPIELIEEVGLLLTNLRIGFDFCISLIKWRAQEPLYQGHFLDHVFKYCSLLEKLESSFFILESCNLEPSINTSIEELVFGFTKIYPIMLKQLSI